MIAEMNMMMEMGLDEERDMGGGGMRGEKGLNGWHMDLSERENSCAGVKPLSIILFSFQT